MSKEEDNKIAVRSTAEVATHNSVPDYLQDDELSNSNAGLETLTGDDIKIPRLVLAQKMSPQVEDGNPKQIEGLAPGMFFNSLTKEIYGKGPLLITPLFVRVSRRLFGPLDAGSPTLCMSSNGLNGGRLSKTCASCSKSKFQWNVEKNKNMKPECTMFYTYLILLYTDDDHFVPMTASLKSTSIDAAKEFNSFMAARQKAAFTGVYQLRSVLESKNNFTYNNWKIENAGWVSEKLLNNVKNLFKSYKPADVAEAMDAADTSAALDAEVIDEEVPF